MFLPYFDYSEEISPIYFCIAIFMVPQREVGISKELRYPNRRVSFGQPPQQKSLPYAKGGFQN